MTKIIVIFLINFSILSCTLNDNRKIENGRYSLSHAQYINNDSLIIPMPEDELLIENDSVYYNEFESYSVIKRGTIRNKYLIFENGDSLQFSYKAGFLITYNDSLCYVWFIKDQK